MMRKTAGFTRLRKSGKAVSNYVIALLRRVLKQKGGDNSLTCLLCGNTDMFPRTVDR